MLIIPKIDTEELSIKVRKTLLAMLREGVFAESGKLPPEEVLAQSMGISRTVLRDVLASLESEGFITRRRGIGTIINQHVLNVTSRLDLEAEFLEMVSEAGYEPQIAFVNVNSVPADEEAVKRFGIRPGEKMLVVDRLVLADGIPAIYCIDHIPENLIVSEYSLEELNAPIFEFLEKRCRTKVEMDLTEIQPCLADDSLSQIFGIDKGLPLLFLDEMGYNLEQKPVLWSKEYYRNGIFHLTVLRRKI